MAQPSPTSPSSQRGSAETIKSSQLPIIDNLLRETNRQSSESPSATGSLRGGKAKRDTPLKKFAMFFQGDEKSEDHSSHDPSLETSRTEADEAYDNTIERLPSIDFYRNVMSLKRPSVMRPTLAELLDEHTAYDTDDESSTIDGPKSEADATPSADGVIQKPKGATLAAPTRDVEANKKGQQQAQSAKFGWIKGVLIRCTLNILGVMLFLRLTWITGYAGIGLTTVIILLSSSVTVLTCLSMCAICTNGEVKAGGIYFMLSRSLGPEFGGSIGIIFSVANMVNIALNVVGFSESLFDLLKDNGVEIVPDKLNNIRIIGLIAVTVLLAICMIGLTFEAAMQLVLLVVLSAAVANYVIGTFIGPRSDDAKAKGFVGFSSDTFTENFFPAFTDQLGFIQLFAIFFPSVTGIAAGANISGDLKEPQKAIPQGTLLAILVTDVIYITFTWMAGSSYQREASGNFSMPYCNSTEFKCQYGLMHDFQVSARQSGWGPLISAGVFAATLSSALACLVSAPKIFQAVANDKIYPYLHFFGKGYGKGNEPRRAYLLAFVIACGVICIADLNIIAPIISNFYLASYALVNYACFDASIANSPGFRPSFKYYNKWLALLGALLCITVMFVMMWLTALITIIVLAVLYLYILRRKPDVNWGSSTQANIYTQALRLMQRLQYTREHVKTYRPQILVLSGNPLDRPVLCDFVNGITRDAASLMICGHVFFTDHEQVRQNVSNLIRMVHNYREEVWRWFRHRRVKSFYSAVIASSLREGTQTLIQTAGIGRMRPNILFLGYKSNWLDSVLLEVNEYYNIIVDAFEANLSVAILRLPNGTDYSELMDLYRISDLDPTLRHHISVDHLHRRHRTASVATMASIDSLDTLDDMPGAQLFSPSIEKAEIRSLHHQKQRGSTETIQTTFDDTAATGDGEKQNGCAAKGRHLVAKVCPCIESKTTDITNRPSSAVDLKNVKQAGSSANLEQADFTQNQREVIASINQFKRKIKDAVVDVWWLADDGGLTLLLPHLLATHKTSFQGARLRIFTLANSLATLKTEQQNMVTLLNKFRIRFDDIEVVPDLAKEPDAERLKQFNDLIKTYIVETPTTDDEFEDFASLTSEGYITRPQLLAMKDKTYRHIRLRELLEEHSRNSNLVVLTLPVPRKSVCSSSLYMAWLEYLTRDFPPVLLVRGNQQSVLTFYS